MSHLASQDSQKLVAKQPKEPAAKKLHEDLLPSSCRNNLPHYTLEGTPKRIVLQAPCWCCLMPVLQETGQGSELESKSKPLLAPSAVATTPTTGLREQLADLEASTGDLDILEEQRRIKAEARELKAARQLAKGL